ncbi:unnamed protein product, partial [Nesidiocoris tenuis]
ILVTISDEQFLDCTERNQLPDGLFALKTTTLSYPGYGSYDNRVQQDGETKWPMALLTESRRISHSCKYALLLSAQKDVIEYYFQSAVSLIGLLEST